MAMYPNAHKIKEIFQLRGFTEKMPKFDEYFAMNLDAKIKGWDHHLGAELKGKEAFLAGERNFEIGRYKRVGRRQGGCLI